MSLLQVRNCPDDIYKKVTLIAKKQNRTIAQQVVELLKIGLGQEESNIVRRKELLERIDNRNVDDAVKQIDAVALLREDRDR
jgi:plasmid stability protein